MAASDGHPERVPSSIELRQVSDAELVRYVSSGNDDAMAVLVERYHRLVFSVAVRIVKDEGEAEEVGQIVFLDIFRNAAQFDPSRGTLKIWVLQHTYSRSVNQRRHLKRRQFYSTVELEEVDPINWSVGSIGTNGFSPGEAARLVEQALSCLNPMQLQVVELVYFEGLKFAEAAEKTQTTLESVRHHYYRGLVKVREFIRSSKVSREKRAAIVGAATFVVEVADVKPRTL
jgi:RNA polymerase sigma-70 factor (ECF subfamily)